MYMSVPCSDTAGVTYIPFCHILSRARGGHGHGRIPDAVLHLLVPAAREPDAGVTRSDRDVPVFQVAAPARAVGFPAAPA